MRNGVRVGLIGGAAMLALGVAAAAALGVGGDADPTPRRGHPAPHTAKVTRATLVDFQDVSGELGYGEVVPLRYVPPVAPPAAPPTVGAGQDPAAGGKSPPPPDDSQGLVTWLTAVGSTVDRGKPLLRVDNEPVVLLYGTLPLYRSLRVGTTGPDVKQLEQNLAALGHGGITVDQTFSAATASAVKIWQKAAGFEPTGVVAPGQVIVAPGAIRIAAHKLRVGDRAEGEVLGYTGTLRKAQSKVPADQLRYATAGKAVTVTLPDGRSVPGTVGEVGAPADAGTGAGPAAPVTVDIGDQKALGDLSQGAVVVRFQTEERRDVLTVPVVALVALVEGGYGVQVVEEGGQLRYVAVETGMFARGQVEIVSGDLREGMTVVVTG